MPTAPLPFLARVACRARRPAARLAALLAAAGAAVTTAFAAPAEISPTPLANETAELVKANLMFVLDDSGSMAFDYIPDSVGDQRALRCFGYYGHNRIFYNPQATYTPPVTAAGVQMANAAFNAAPIDGFNPGAGTANLADPANLPTEPTVLNQAEGVTTTVTGAAEVCGAIDDEACDTTTRQTTEREGDVVTTITRSFQRGNAPGLTCSNVPNSCTLTTTTTTTVGQAVAESRYYWSTLKAGAANDCQNASYDVVADPDALDAAARQNYANWYSYYRTRMLMMRSAAGQVFATVDEDRFRVGFSTISENGVANGPRFLNVTDFDAAQKQAFFERLYGVKPAGSTPLRPALNKAGAYFANKAQGQGADPVQYSCQRNFTILSTDGYWNTGAEPPNWTPTKLDGGAIGNQDAGNTPRPLLDDGRYGANGNWVTGGGGVANSLADIAKYFYDTDLRAPGLGNCAGSVAGQDVCENNLRITSRDTARHQHMTTFTLGLGVPGEMEYRADYETAVDGDFFGIRNGTRPWPNPLSDSNGGRPSNNATVTARIDDLWHAAVNGRGIYFSAGNQADLVQSLTRALRAIDNTTGTGSAAATSSLRPTVGDNAVYLAKYTAGEWSGRVEARRIDVATGDVTDDVVWNTDETLSALVGAAADQRRIVYRSPNGGLREFTFDNLAADGYGDRFAGACNGDAALSQCATLGGGVALANNGRNMVNWLRGQTQFEQRDGNAIGNRVYRGRPDTPLGDIVDASPLYVGRAVFDYTDEGYAEFKARMETRRPVVYVPANDGMLHAIDAQTGRELWAYVPSMVFGQMKLLADTAYDANHRFLVDATPTIGDVFANGQWRTVLVGGLGAGGRGYYALDITDPDAPQALWEISSEDDLGGYVDEDLGLSFASPVVTKSAAGRWIAAFTSGYNNVEPGDGQGYVYIRDVLSGAEISKIGTGAGDAQTPSNLGRLEGWVDDDTDNTSRRLYAGDMLGNLWRIDYDDQVAPGGVEASLLGRLQAPDGTPQPITIKPTLAVIVQGGTTVPVVIVATGRYLGRDDLNDQTVQTIYVIKDPLNGDGLGVVRTAGGVRALTLAENGVDANGARTRAIVNPIAFNWAVDNGWYVDLTLSAGERVNVDLAQTGQTLFVASNVPAANVCSAGGSSWFYSFDLNGGTLNTSAESTALTAGLNLLQVGDTLRVIQWDVASGYIKRDGPPPLPTAERLQRTSWRELVD